MCRTGHFRYCWQTQRGGLRYGSTPMSVSPGLWGGYSQYLYLHPGAVIHRLPDSGPAHLMAPFLPLSNGVSLAIDYGGVRLGSSVLIQGPGEHGLCAAMAAHAAGAACIIVAGLSIDDGRLDIARRLGAHHTVDVEREDLVARVKDITGGEGVDVVINITGAGTNTVQQGLACAGTLATIVLSDAGEERLDLAWFGRRDLVIKSSNGHSYESVEQAIQMIVSGEFPIAELSTTPYPLNQASEAIDAVAGVFDRSITFTSIVPEVR